MPEPFDKALIDRAKAGDAHALTEIYVEYRPVVYRYLFYRLGDEQSAEDLTTEVFLRVLQKLTDYQHRGTPFQAWLFQIAHNLVIDHFRKMNSHPQSQLDDGMVDQKHRVDVLVEQSLSIQELQKALRRLTADQCDVIILRFLAGMPINQVAKALNKSEGAIKALQMRGLEALERILSQRAVFHD